MFEELVESYKLLKTSDKRTKLIEDIKYLIAVFEQICKENNLEPQKITSREILDLNNGNESEDDFLEALFVYFEYLKEVAILNLHVVLGVPVRPAVAFGRRHHAALP